MTIHATPDDEAEKVIQDVTREMRRIECDLKIASATANVELARVASFWLFGLFVALMGIATVFGGSTAPTWSETLTMIVKYGAMAIALHTVAWLGLQAYVKALSRRD